MAEEESWTVVTLMISALILGEGGLRSWGRADAAISLPLLIPAGPLLCGGRLSHQAAQESPMQIQHLSGVRSWGWDSGKC